MKIGTVLKSKTCPKLFGKVKKSIDDKHAIVEVIDKDDTIKEIVICLECWDIIE